VRAIQGQMALSLTRISISNCTHDQNTSNREPLERPPPMTTRRLAVHRLFPPADADSDPEEEDLEDYDSYSVAGYRFDLLVLRPCLLLRPCWGARAHPGTSGPTARDHPHRLGACTETLRAPNR
jgi:hypothetical protein